MIKDLLPGYSFPKMSCYKFVEKNEKQGSIIFTSFNEKGKAEISLSDLQRLAKHINAEYVFVSEINLVDFRRPEYEIIVKYRLY